MRLSPGSIENSGMPLNPEAKPRTGQLDAFDDAIGRHRINDHRIRDRFNGLMMGAVD